MITCDGLKASKKNTDAVSMMSDTIDKEGVRRVLGTVNYLSKFLPNLANVVEPLRRMNIMMLHGDGIRNQCSKL